ncbi:MAG TPA: hypothetical protein VI504_06730 [Candidatus Eisenbacteria bacterium]|jgi:hypothetical protein
MKQPRRAVIALGSMLALCLWCPGAEPKPVGHDRLVKGAGVDQARLRLVALLPVVSETDDRRAEKVVEDCLDRLYEGTGWPRVSTVESATRLAPAATTPDSLLRKASKQVWRKGVLDSTTARLITRQLGTDAVLTVRINRWERWPGSDPTHARAFVDLTAALADSSGSLLWKVSGREAVKTPRALLDKLDLTPGAWGVRARYGRDFVPGDFVEAVSAVLARWLRLVPPPPS